MGVEVLVYIVADVDLECDLLVHEYTQIHWLADWLVYFESFELVELDLRESVGPSSSPPRYMCYQPC
jgi:hypothetical protein